MPPDRIATSFAEAQEYGLALSSTPLSKGAPSIARGQACQTCRRRKLRCDGIRPLCTSCKKSALAHGDNIDFLSCKYDEPEPKKSRRRQPANGNASTSAAAAGNDPAKVKELEAEIAELKAMMARAGLGPNANADAAASTSLSPTAPTSSSGRWPSPAGVAPWLPSAPSFATGMPAMTVVPDHLSSNWVPEPVQLSPPPSGSSHGASPASTSPSATTASNSLFDLFYPGWPRDLPSPDLTSRLIEIYFTRPHAAQGMINASRFRSAMLLSPTSAGFPHPALIHAVCAVAAMIISPDYFRSEEPYWQHVASSASEYHFNGAKAGLERAVCFGANLFQLAQANFLITYYAHNNARFVELWMHCGQATRMCTPLGLNHLRAACDADSLPKSVQGKGALLGRTDDPEELIEQALTFYGCLCADRFSAASTGWAVSLDDEDFSTPIPGLQGFPTSDIENSVLSPRNPQFFVAHPPHLVGPQQLYLKAVVLLGKVVQFSHRAPFTAKFAQSSLNDGAIDVRKTDAFKRLENTCTSFIASIPREYQMARRSAMGIRADVLTEVYICLVHSMAHSAFILLHEPHVASLNDDDESMVKSLASANEILQAIFLALNASTEISLYSPYINYCWAVAGRTLVRKMAMLQLACRPGGRELRSNVETILAVLDAHKTPLGKATGAQLQMHLDDPYRALPFVLQQQARAQAGVPTPSAASLREMSGCPAMLDVAGTFASAEESSSSSSPLNLIEMNGGKEPVGILQPLRDLARTMDDAAPLLAERWSSSTGTGGATASTISSTRTFAASASSPSTVAVAAIPFSDVVQDSPIAMPGIIEEIAMPSPSSAAELVSSSSMEEDASTSLFDFASLVGGRVGGGTSLPDPRAAAAAAAGVGGSGPTGNSASLDFDPTTLWNANNGLDAIEALLKIQQAALG
ncbi:hypothetical protein B0A53_01678 [Rhodotorula sp. CCFEE 5036]|nr:hypothetical protein B0A53_01678 [Rhodotorula sp. CCFEE 5036]